MKAISDWLRIVVGVISAGLLLHWLAVPAWAASQQLNQQINQQPSQQTISHHKWTVEQALSHWRSLYGEQILFDVHRNGDPVGQYLTRFVRDGNKLRVDARMDLQLSWLFWDYHYRYRASEWWWQGRLDRLESQIDDNGELTQFRFTGDGERLVSSDPKLTIPLPLLASHHYNADIRQQRQVLNTLTGQVNQIELEHLGHERLLIGSVEVPAQRYRYQGELRDTEVWYDAHGRWLSLRFFDQRGATIEFRCRQCGTELNPSVNYSDEG